MRVNIKRGGLVAASLTAGILLAIATPARADDGWATADCDQMPTPVCDLEAGQGGDEGQPGPDPGTGHNVPDRTGSRRNQEHDGAGQGDTLLGDQSNSAECSYAPSDYRPPSGGVIPAGYTPAPALDGAGMVLTSLSARGPVPAVRAQKPSGAWYVWKCTGEGVTDALYRPPRWIPDGQEPGVGQALSPAEVAQLAREQLRLPEPVIAANPAGEQLVNLPTWLWLTSGWGPVSATASVPGVSVTATATPKQVSWSMGDGSTVICTGPGTVYASGADPTTRSPDCGHTYVRSSANQPGQAYPVTATLRWAVTWSGAGEGGTFPDMTTTSTASFRVAESQALNTGGN